MDDFVGIGMIVHACVIFCSGQFPESPPIQYQCFAGQLWVQRKPLRRHLAPLARMVVRLYRELDFSLPATRPISSPSMITDTVCANRPVNLEISVFGIRTILPTSVITTRSFWLRMPLWFDPLIDSIYEYLARIYNIFPPVKHKLQVPCISAHCIFVRRSDAFPAN